MSIVPDPSTLALVTGAPGWLGSRLVESLTRGVPDVPELSPMAGRTIRCLVQPGADITALQATPGVTCVSGDLADQASLVSFVDGAAGSVLFHCAGVIHPRRIADLDAVNARGTSQLLQAATRARVRRFVHVSSNSPFGANPSRDDVFTESAPYRPYMGYGRSKMAGEQSVLAAASRIETVVVRAPWFYGPGQPPRQTQFFTMIKQGGFPLMGDGGNRRSMAYVDNLCQGLVRCERQDGAAGQAYWIADERAYAMSEIVDTVEGVMLRDFGIAVSGKRLRLPSFASDVARVCDRAMQAVGLYDQRVHVLSEMNLTIACSIDKAKQQLGYRPAVALEEGMRRSIAWVLAQGITI